MIIFAVPYRKVDYYMITKITITPMNSPMNGIVAFAHITVDDVVNINSITVRLKQDGKGLYVRMPQKKTTNGNYIDVAHPMSKEGRATLNAAVLGAYKKACENGINKQEYGVPENYKLEISARNCVKYEPGKFGNALGRLDITVGDMVIHNCRVYLSKDGNMNISMPMYQDKEGQYHAIVVPSDKAAYNELRSTAVNEYNINYVVRKVSEQELDALKNNTDIDFQAKETNGEIAIRFKAEDAQRVDNCLKVVQAMQNAPSPVQL